jgi:drug/metabolite transporter (DMT)-like permease
VVVIITAMGVLTLGPLSFFSAGAATLMATPWQQYALMFAAGVCNLIAFCALVRGLQLTTVLHVNMINAGQVAIAAVVGVLFFGETCNRWLLLGVGLMIVGFFAFGSPVDQEAIDAHV